MCISLTAEGQGRILRATQMRECPLPKSPNISIGDLNAQVGQERPAAGERKRSTTHRFRPLKVYGHT